jgi:hypothetical protein
MSHVLARRMAVGFATSLDRLVDGLIPIRASGTAVELEDWGWIEFTGLDDEPADSLRRALDDAQDTLMHATTEQWPAPGAEPGAAVDGELARLWFDRPSGPRIELLPVWLTTGIEGVAQLLEGRFRLRGPCWRFDWNLHGVDASRLVRGGDDIPEEVFGCA